MTGTKSPRNDFVLVSCKHDANFDIRAGLTSSRSHVNEALESRFDSVSVSAKCMINCQRKTAAERYRLSHQIKLLQHKRTYIGYRLT